MDLSALVIPLLFTGTALYGLRKRVDIYNALATGAENGLTMLLRILPTLVCLLTAVSMLRASGTLEWLTELCAPLMDFLGIPPETMPLMLIRPISGSGALAVGSELIEEFGADSHLGRVVAVMLGSSETTFYTIAVYFGAAGIRRIRHTIPAALTADFLGFFASALAVQLFFGSA